MSAFTHQAHPPADAAAASYGCPAERSRFTHAWWRQFDTPASGYRDSTGFMNRLPLRLESIETLVHGTVDAAKMWADFDGEAYVPVLVGARAVVTIWFNTFTDTDCGGAYLETWYNTYVTRKDRPLQLVMESPMSVILDHPDVKSFLCKAICGDAPGNPGAAMHAVTGGREIWGFPKHPIIASIRAFEDEANGTAHFQATHQSRHVVSLAVRVPEADEGVISIPIEAETPKDFVIGGPRLGGTHLGHNGANQMMFGQAVCCTQHIGLWNSRTDTLALGDDAHYSVPLKSWGFDPLIKVHSTDFKICASKPIGWVTGEEAAAAVDDHEAQRARGVTPGAVATRNAYP